MLEAGENFATVKEELIQLLESGDLLKEVFAGGLQQLLGAQLQGLIDAEVNGLFEKKIELTVAVKDDWVAATYKKVMELNGILALQEKRMILIEYGNQKLQVAVQSVTEECTTRLGCAAKLHARRLGVLATLPNENDVVVLGTSKNWNITLGADYLKPFENSTEKLRELVTGPEVKSAADIMRILKSEDCRWS